MNGWFLLAPAGLLALAALALPVVIHLISRSHGRRVPVGNIALYRQAKRQRVTEFRPVQWWLLALRLALLALAALLLAGLARPGTQTLSGTVAYLTPDWHAAAPDDARAALARFDTVQLLSEGYPEPGGADTTAPVDPGPWALLAERLDQVNHTGEVHVFALGRAGQFAAPLPPLGDELTWHLLDADAPGQARLAALRAAVVFAPGREADAALLALALERVAEHRRVDFAVRRLPLAAYRAGDVEANGDSAVLWLADTPPPPLVDAAVVLSDRVGPGAPRLAQPPTWPGTAFLARSPTDGAPAADAWDSNAFHVAWRDEAGTPLLLERAGEDQRRLLFLDRLDAGPEGLLATETFPDTLLRLLLGEARWREGLATAPADPTPTLARALSAAGQPHRSLAPWLALLVALLFGLERWLAERPRDEERTT